MRSTSGWKKRQEARAASYLPDPRLLSLDQLTSEVQALLDVEEGLAYLWVCGRPGCDGAPHDGAPYPHARAEQWPPDQVWRIWLLLTGRGWGKTRTGAETVRSWCQERPRHIAVIAKTDREVRNICFEAPRAGLLAVLPKEAVARYHKSSGSTMLLLTNGSIIRAFTAEAADNLRGYAFDGAWCDEYAAWPMNSAQDVFDQLWFCLREAADPKVIVTTTPKALPHVKRLMERAKVDPSVVLTRGHMRDNVANLSQAALDELTSQYEGTRLGRQELAGELLEDVEGALWAMWMFEVEGFRIHKDHLPDLARVVVAVDPAMTSREDSDASGIAVCGVDYGRPSTFADQRPHGYLLESRAMRGLPQATMKEVARLYHAHEADAVVIEANNGGDYLPAVLAQVDPSIPVRLVHAKRGKHTRAEPISAFYEQYRMHHVGPPGAHATVEEQMTTWTDTGTDVSRESPDVMDALVWGFTDLMLGSGPATTSPMRDQRLRGRR